ncbi:MAG: hypothetical protein N4A33_12640 [Bacteriovoracaceae bacterium]|jgi:hypothetical protein|nr:hypothetical protein [Bacteriovoracaceae bacterium]
MNLSLKQLMLTATFVTSSFSSVTTASISNTRSALFLPEGFSGNIELSSNQLVEDVGEVEGNQFRADLNLKYEKSESASVIGKKFELKTRYNNKENFMFSIPEAYISTHLSKYNIESSFGRFVLPWSHADKNWSFGKLNNRVNFDGFDPGQEGLTGLRAFKQFSNGIKIDMFASFIYVPEMNPNTVIDEDKGTITCKNAWCDAPPAQANVSGTYLPVFYNVEMPNISTIVFNPSYGTRLGFSHEEISIDAFYMKKPENTVSTPLEVGLNGSIVEVDVTPEVYYHEVYGGDIKYDFTKNFALNLTSLFVRPSKTPEVASEVKTWLEMNPKKIQEDYVGGGFEYKDNNMTGAINYIARISEFDKESDPLLQYPRWNQAIHFNIGSHITRKVSVGLDYKFDMLTEDRLTMIRANYQVSPSLMTSLGVNMIGTNEKEESYWDKFVNNDAFYGSLKYLF